MASIVDRLLRSDDPSVVWQTRVRLLGESSDSPAMRELQATVRTSDAAQRLLAGRDADGRITRHGVYDKWLGAHWVLAALADIGYPAGDKSLTALRDQVQQHWLAETFYREFVTTRRPTGFADRGVPVIQGRYRRCGSMQGNALRAIVALGLADERTAELAERLLHWQWPDGGWNCDKNPDADTSSFCETLLPMRGLMAYATTAGDKPARTAALRAAEVFLSRELLYRRGDGNLMRAEFVKLHYPLYWHYDLLGGLLGMADCGLLADERCARALDVLRDKRLPDGGWPVTEVYYRVADAGANVDSVNWGGSSAKRFHPLATIAALTVLAVAGDDMT